MHFFLVCTCSVATQSHVNPPIPADIQETGDGFEFEETPAGFRRLATLSLSGNCDFLSWGEHSFLLVSWTSLRPITCNAICDVLPPVHKATNVTEMVHQENAQFIECTVRELM